MKNTINLLVFVCLSISVFSQEYEMQQIIYPTPFYLCSVTNINATGNRSRTTFKVDLPENTVEWYYIFSTQKNTEPAPINLLVQANGLMRKMAPGSEIVGSILGRLTTNIGIDRCDIYVATKEGADDFMAREYMNWVHSAPTRHLREGARLGVSSGKVAIDDVLSGTVYLCVKNPNSMTGIYVDLQVVALVDKNPKWQPDQKDKLYERFSEMYEAQSFGESAVEVLAHCITEKVISRYTLNELRELSDYESRSLLDMLDSECKDLLIGLIEAESQERKQQNKAIDYGDMGWHMYEDGDLEGCIEYSKKALEIDNTLAFAKGNCGLCLLEKGIATEAMEYYIEAANDLVEEEDRETMEALIDDLEKSIVKNPEMSGAKSILKLLKSKIWW